MSSNRKPLGVAFIGAGFINSVHAKSWLSVRDSEIVAICNPTMEKANKLANLCSDLGVGRPKVYSNLRDAVNDPRVDAVWVATPNYARISVIRTITEEVLEGNCRVMGIACEKPLATSIPDAKEMIRLVDKAGILHGYLENQVYAPSVTRGKEVIWGVAKEAGRPYLARASEEHGGPHSSWFWIPQKAGGGVAMDMLCHSLEATRFMLTSPQETREQVQVRSVYAEMASLKWTQPNYVEQLKRASGGQVDYSKSPAEDFCRAVVTFAASDGSLLIADTSALWCYTGPGVRMTIELLGPEYSMSVNTLQPELHVFFSRNLSKSHSYFVEKQAADQGLMPALSDESFTYGFQAENRHMVQSFIQNQMPFENWRDGLSVLELIMTCYMAAERGERLKYPPPSLDDYVPQPARGEWNPKQQFIAA